MSKEKRQVEKKDLMSADIYAESRKQIRKDLVEFKKNRRIALGPYATFYFESFLMFSSLGNNNGHSNFNIKPQLAVSVIIL